MSSMGSSFLFRMTSVWIPYLRANCSFSTKTGDLLPLGPVDRVNFPKLASAAPRLNRSWLSIHFMVAIQAVR